MGMEFEKLKKNNFPTDRPIPEKQGRVKGNKNIFKVGLGTHLNRFADAILMTSNEHTQHRCL